MSVNDAVEQVGAGPNSRPGVTREFQPQQETCMSPSVPETFVQIVASEMSTCVDRAVERWMTELDSILNDTRLTTLGRLQGISAVVTRYKNVTGKAELPGI